MYYRQFSHLGDSATRTLVDRSQLGANDSFWTRLSNAFNSNEPLSIADDVFETIAGADDLNPSNHHVFTPLELYQGWKELNATYKIAYDNWKKSGIHVESIEEVSPEVEVACICPCM